jgi:hypothetical protein
VNRVVSGFSGFFKLVCGNTIFLNLIEEAVFLPA